MNFVDHILAENYDRFGLAAHGLRRGWGTVLLTPRFVTSRHLVALVFNAGSRTPVLVVKVPRQPGDNEGVQRESDMLSRLTTLHPDVAGGWPEVVATVDVGDHTVFVETALTGAQLDPERVIANTPGAIRAGVAFVAQLPVTRTAEQNHDWYERAISAPMRALVEVAPMGGEMIERVERTHRALAPLRTAALPAVFEHADLSHPNIFVQPDGRMQVVDWERAVIDGVPGHHLVFYLQYVHESATQAYVRTRQLAAFDEVWGPDGWGQPLLREHLSLRGVDPGLAPALVLATWARSAATLAYRLAPQVPERSTGDQARVDHAVSTDRDFWLWRHILDERPV